MEKGPAFLLAFLITALIAGNYLFFTDAGVSRERVNIERVLDGDTVELTDGRHIRLTNINTPEKKLAYSELAKNYLIEFADENVELEDLGVDKYGRTLGRLYSGDEYINLEIVRQGFAHSYIVFDGEEREFSKAEEKARNSKSGIWELSPYAECVSIKINKYDEYVEIRDSCGVDFAGWTLKDESTKMYRFSQDAGDEFILYSGKGEDTGEKLYWGKGKVWNDDKDRIFIRDSDGKLVFYDSYS